MSAELPIGVFDSGIGGLTVVHALRQALPSENILYLGDTARVPYGSKSPDTVIRYARACAEFLVGRGIKVLVVACNTASAHALLALRQQVDVILVDAVGPGAVAAHRASDNGHVGVLGTLGTVRSGAYPRALAAQRPGLVVSQMACPLLVPLAEEGWTDGPVPEQVAWRYLAELAEKDRKIDTLVLGCTHYPLLQTVLDKVAEATWAHRVTLVDSAGAMAETTRALLKADGLLGTRAGRGELELCVTDASRLEELAPRFLAEPFDGFSVVDL